MAKFPDGVKIAPGQHITLAFSGTAFTTEYSIASDFEIQAGDAAIPDMVAIDVGSTAGLTNNGEAIILFYWDGQSDLVQDVDIVVWGDQKEAVDKTGIKIDGPDADSDSTEYAADTPIAQQSVVNADNDGEPNPHDNNKSAQRRLNVEDVEKWGANGNGITGHDETGENLSWKGGIWSIHEAPTPGRRALGDSLAFADLQFVRAEDIGEMKNDDSPFPGDTVTVTGIAMHGIREIFTGEQFAVFLTDEHGGPWSGLLLLQEDSTAGMTNFTALKPGHKIRVKGLVSELPPDPNTVSVTELNLLLDPVAPIQILATGLPLPDPVLLKPEDVGDAKVAERWESMLVHFKNLTVTDNGLPGNIMLAGDATGSIALDDHFRAVFDAVDANGGIWPGFSPGARIDVTGFVSVDTSQGIVTINPRTLADLEVVSAPPKITAVRRKPAAVKPTDTVEISAQITDANATVARATLHYRANGGDYQTIPLATSDNISYSATIPAQADSAMIEYFLSAVNSAGDSASSPADTADFKYFYFVREAGIAIFDLQFSPYCDARSGYLDHEVTVTGIVTTDVSDFTFYWIQNGSEPWNGILVFDESTPAKLGDEVRVTGTVDEFGGATEIRGLTAFTLLSENNPVPEPVVLTTGELGTTSATAESFEGMLVRVENVGVSDPFPDAPSNFGEFVVDDGSGGVRILNLATSFQGNLDSTFALGDSLLSITGIQHESFGNKKIAPRDINDLVRKTTAVADGSIPLTYDLAQNYPNPFNPQTTIRYRLAKPGLVTITIHNLLGQKIRTLVEEVRPAGAHKMVWNGRSGAGLSTPSGVYFYRIVSGEFIEVKKMILVK
jgi:DNA/RNA endonuclease YhcR with UshA esterase domain